jgi:predicted ATPase
MGRHATGLTRLCLGELVAARAVMERCRDFADPACRSGSVGMNEDPYVATLGNLAVTLALLGYLDQARLQLSEALSEARRLGHALTLAIVLAFANQHDWLTSSPELKGHAEELSAVSNEHGFPFYSSVALIFQGSLLAELGQAQEALTLIMRGITELHSTGAELNLPIGRAVLAKAYAMLGQPLEGLNCLTEAVQFIEQTEERVGEAGVHRLRGDLLKTIGDVAGAELSYQQAIAIAKRQSAKMFELRASTSLARLWRDQGKRDEARDLLAPVYGWFTEGFDTPDLKEAKALLEELAA